MFYKLSFLYFSYFALLGVMAPYLGLYLDAADFDLFEIAQLMSLLMLTKIFAPMIWATISDRFQCHLLMIRCGALMTLVFYSGFFVAESFWEYAIVISLFSFFWNAVLPQIEVVTLFNLGPAKDRYSRIRLWGSIGFILSVLVFGVLIDLYGIQLFPIALLFIMSCILAASLFSYQEPVSDKKNTTNESRFYVLFLRWNVLAFFIVCFLLQVSHGAYYTYFSIYLEEAGYQKVTIGWLWSLGVIAEVVLFVYMYRWYRCQTLQMIVIISLILTLLRWFFTPLLLNSLVGLIFLQCLHAFSFGAMHAVAIQFIHQRFELKQQGRAQAMYSSIGFGAGGAVGALLSGWLVTNYGYEQAFWGSALVVVFALFISSRSTFQIK